MDVFHAIMRTEPRPVHELRPELPQDLGRIVRRCLAKDPEKRSQSAKDVRNEFAELREQMPGPSDAVVIPTTPREASAGPADSAGQPLQASSAAGTLATTPRDGAPEEQYFADGMTEALTSHLAKIEALKVISRTSVMQYRDAPKSIPRIATELGLGEPVRWIVEGSVQRAGDRVRISAQLIDAPADRHVWAENYDRDVRDVLVLQSDVARAIAGEIRVRITPQDESRIAEDRRIDPEAHDAYLRGLHHYEEAVRAGFARRDSFDRAVEFFHKAIDIEPHWAKAHGQLGAVYHFIASIGTVAEQSEFYPQAKTALLRALELDDELAQARASLAFVLVRHEWDWDGASREYRRARELEPNHDPWGYALFLLAAGRLDEAISEFRIARELSPQVASVQRQLVLALRCGGRLEEAAREARTAVEFYPERPEVYYDLAKTLIAAGSYDQAIEAVREGLELAVARADEPSRRSASYNGALQLAYAYAKVGRSSEARQILERLESDSPTAPLMDPAPPTPELLFALGETERSLAEIERQFAERDEALLYIRCSPEWERLRELPRVREIVRQIGFPAGDLSAG